MYKLSPGSWDLQPDFLSHELPECVKALCLFGQIHEDTTCNSVSIVKKILENNN